MNGRTTFTNQRACATWAGRLLGRGEAFVVERSIYPRSLIMYVATAASDERLELGTRVQHALDEQDGE